MTDRLSAGRIRGGRRARWGRVVTAGLAVALLAWAWPATAPGLLAAGETLALSPTNGQPGDHSTATGTGFTGGTTVSVTWPGGAVIGSGAWDGAGGFTIDIAIPTDATPNTYTITACATILSGCDGGQATADYTVDTPPPTPTPAPALSLLPPSGQPGDHSNATGTNFTGGTTVSVTWPGGAVIGSGTWDGAGGFTIDIAIPTDATPNTYTVTACATTSSGCDGGQADATYTVAPLPTPGPTPSPSPTPKPGGPSQTPEATTTHLPTEVPSGSGSPGTSPAPGSSATPVVGPSGGPTGGSGGEIPPLTLALIAAFATLCAGLWAFARITAATGHGRAAIPGPVERLVAGLFAAGVILAVVAGGATAETDRPAGKVVICRLDTLNGTYRPIQIDATAIDAHLLRGDVEPNAAGACP